MGEANFYYFTCLNLDVNRQVTNSYCSKILCLRMSKDYDQRAKARRIAENAGEEEESKKREKLQWMYGQKENDEEEYLLGKAVKDELDFCRQEEKRVEDSFGSLYAQRDSASTLQVDMTAKLREDPWPISRRMTTTGGGFMRIPSKWRNCEQFSVP